MNSLVMIDTQIISPTKQREWTSPAAANFVLGGAGAGFYLLSIFIMILERERSIMIHPISFGIFAPVLMGLGFVFLITEAGRPSKGRYILFHLQRAWISRETLAFTFFVPAVIFDYFFPHLIFKVCAALSALCFMVAQGFILYSSRAVPAWNVSIIPIFFISSGFASGAGLALLLAASGRLKIEAGLELLSMACIIWNLIVWLLYLRWSNAIDFRSAIKALYRPLIILITIVFGHALPILILLLLQIQLFPEMGKMLQGVFALVSGLAIIIGVAAQKASIVLSSGFTGEITIKSR